MRCGESCRSASFFQAGDSLIPAPPRVRVRLVVHLPPSPVGYVRVELRGGEVGMAEHLLHRAKIGPAFEQMRGEGVAQEMRMHSLGLEAGFACEPAKDQERTRASERPAACVEKELRAVPHVEERPAPRQVAAKRLARGATHGDDAFLVSLTD